MVLQVRLQETYKSMYLLMFVGKVKYEDFTARWYPTYFMLNRTLICVVISQIKHFQWLWYIFKECNWHFKKKKLDSVNILIWVCLILFTQKFWKLHFGVIPVHNSSVTLVHFQGHKRAQIYNSESTEELLFFMFKVSSQQTV